MLPAWCARAVRSTASRCAADDAPIPMTAEQTRELVDAIATATSLDALADLQRLARRQHLFDPRGGFLEMLVDARHAPTVVPPPRDHGSPVQR